MAKTLTFKVPYNFDLELFTFALSDSFQTQDFETTISFASSDSAKITFKKDCGGIYGILGMGQRITANFSLNGDTLEVNYTNGAWAVKIICLLYGYVLFLIPFITAIKGCVRQSKLPKKINAEISTILSKM